MTTPLTPGPMKKWLLEVEDSDPGGYYEGEREAVKKDHVQPWWRVMCLTGVDYFSTLGYQPGIAALAAGALAPVATLVLVLVTLFAALPMYRRVATESPHGDGSLSMLQRLLSYWPSKLLVLSLLGFVATGFIVTITLSGADAAAHLVENPFLKDALHGKEVLITLVLIALLAAVFLKGFSEAIGVAVVLVVAYLGLSSVVLVRGIVEVVNHPSVVGDWTDNMTATHSMPFGIIAASLLVFPALALGLSGFETGVVVMPLVKGDPTDTHDEPLGRIRNAKKLLTSAALIMSVLLVGSSLVTTMLIPEESFQPGGRPTVARWRSWRTRCSVTGSARPTTSRRSASCGSPVRAPWPGCSTSCRATCRSTAWHRTGRTRPVRSSSCCPASLLSSPSRSRPTSTSRRARMPRVFSR
ncbi:MAG: hypothetical protein ABIW49_12520 [Knoellia sp.]